ncbi:MAG: hypothetical protein II194_07770 [Bacteroidales bacterium]|nr:hypothetical protein [Bacteroidales bacterium]
MDTLFLNVKTVQTFEPVTYAPHTAYSVYAEEYGSITIASEWTLRDAISLFAKIYNYNPASIRLRRPFRREKGSFQDLKE